MVAMFVVIFLEQWLKEKDHTSSLLGAGDLPALPDRVRSRQLYHSGDAGDPCSPDR